MKVYIDKLPKDCIDCPCESEYYCNLLNEDIGCCEWGEIHKNCPLQSLADYTKQVRKDVCDEIIKSIHYYPISLLDIDKEPRIKTLGISKEVLDTILKEYQK